MVDIAQRCGVSVVTVSNALSGRSGVSEEVRQHIQQAALDLGYKKKSPAAVPASRQRHIGIIVAQRFFGVQDSFYFEIYQQLLMELRAQEAEGVLEIVDEAREQDGLMPQLLGNPTVAGILVLGQLQADYLKLLAATGKPLLFFDFHIPNLMVDSVEQDNIGGGHAATSYLLQQGHRHIAFVGSVLATTSVMERYLGYQAAFLEKGLQALPWLPDRDSQGRALTLQLPEPLPTAFFCNSDNAAFQVVQALHERGLKIPDDASLISFDDSRWRQRCLPHLSSMAIDIRAFCQLAVRRLLERLMWQGGFDLPHTIPLPCCQLRLPVQCILRQSIRQI